MSEIVLDFFSCSRDARRVRCCKDVLAFASVKSRPVVPWPTGMVMTMEHWSDFSAALCIFLRKTPKSWRGKGNGSEGGA